jgi:FRG domain
MIEEHSGTIGQLIDSVKSIVTTWTPSIIDAQEIWFRGVSKAKYELVPGLFRPHIQRLNYDEVALFERFKVFATPHVRRDPVDDWEWYFLAQHYGLPTRLLDWTESLLAAAYFAVCDSILCGDRLAVDQDLVRGKQPSIFDDESPVVWILDAGTLNQAASGDDYPFVPGGELTARYLPEVVAEAPDNDNRLPLALLARRANERITAQQGTFTIHGHATDSLHALAKASTTESSIRLARVVLDRANLSHFWNELEMTGMTKHALFPGVDTAAEHVKWIMQSVKPGSAAIIKEKA